MSAPLFNNEITMILVLFNLKICILECTISRSYFPNNDTFTSSTSQVRPTVAESDNAAARTAATAEGGGTECGRRAPHHTAEYAHESPWLLVVRDV